MMLSGRHGVAEEGQRRSARLWRRPLSGAYTDSRDASVTCERELFTALRSLNHAARYISPCHLRVPQPLHLPPSHHHPRLSTSFYHQQLIEMVCPCLSIVVGTPY